MNSSEKQPNIELILTTYMLGTTELLRHGQLSSDQLEQLLFTKESLNKLEQHNISQDCWDFFEWLISLAETAHTKPPSEVKSDVESIRWAIERHLGNIATPRKYTDGPRARLWLSGPSMNPNKITRLLELPPDWKKHPDELHYVRFGPHDVQRGSNIFPGGHWWMNSSAWVEGGPDAPLDEHIRWILSQFEGKEEVLLAICESGVSASLFCVCSTWDYETDLVDPALRKQVEAMGISISLNAFDPAWG